MGVWIKDYPILLNSLPKECFNFEKLVSNSGRSVKGHCAVIAKIIISFTQWCLSKNELLACTQKTCFDSEGSFPSLLRKGSFNSSQSCFNSEGSFDPIKRSKRLLMESRDAF